MPMARSASKGPSSRSGPNPAPRVAPWPCIASRRIHQNRKFQWRWDGKDDWQQALRDGNVSPPRGFTESQQDFDRHSALHSRLKSLINSAHTSSAKFRPHFETTVSVCPVRLRFLSSGKSGSAIAQVCGLWIPFSHSIGSVGDSFFAARTINSPSNGQDARSRSIRTGGIP